MFNEENEYVMRMVEEENANKTTTQRRRRSKSNIKEAVQEKKGMGRE